MKPKSGDRLKSILDGEDYIIKKVVENMAMLESQNGKKQILTELDTLRLSYRKKEEMSSWIKKMQCYLWLDTFPFKPYKTVSDDVKKLKTGCTENLAFCTRRADVECRRLDAMPISLPLAGCHSVEVDCTARTAGCYPCSDRL